MLYETSYMHHDTDRPRGFAFVEMDNAETAIAALDKESLGGRNLKLNIAGNKSSGGMRDGGGNRRGGPW
jgi:RNA recognition motif-containing protein